MSAGSRVRKLSWASSIIVLWVKADRFLNSCMCSVVGLLSRDVTSRFETRHKHGKTGKPFRALADKGLREFSPTDR